jgi:hypothetical protein
VKYLPLLPRRKGKRKAGFGLGSLRVLGTKLEEPIQKELKIRKKIIRTKEAEEQEVLDWNPKEFIDTLGN